MDSIVIAFANTLWSSGDALSSPAGLSSWLRGAQDVLAVDLPDDDLRVSDQDWHAALELRAAVRELAAGHRPDPVALNAAARSAPRWHELSWHDDEPSASVHTAGTPVASALAEIAEAAILLFAGPDRRPVHACGAPTCIRFFIKEHPRREWCSPTCGNRVRVARHYAKSKPH